MHPFHCGEASEKHFLHVGQGHFKTNDANVRHQGRDREHPQEEVDDHRMTDGHGVARQRVIVVNHDNVDQVHDIAHPG